MSALFCSVGAYAAQNVSFQFERLLHSLFAAEAYDDYLRTVIFILLSVFFVGVFSYFGFAKRIKDSVVVEHVPLLVISVLILALVIVCSENIPWRADDVLYRVYAIISGILALCVQFGIFNDSELKVEEKALRQMLALQEKQQALARYNMDLINIKYHDLKHLVTAEGEKGLNLSSEQRREFESISETYGTIVKTENASLDIVLTEKALVAKRNGIQFSTIADGKLLDFISEADIYALFGNILDNAIEGVMREDDPDKRIISLKIARRGALITVESENYCPGTPKFENGLPVTTKPDKDNHGFGMLSIKYLIRRYNGTLDIRVNDNWFKIRIMFFAAGETALSA